MIHKLLQQRGAEYSETTVRRYVHRHFPKPVRPVMRRATTAGVQRGVDSDGLAEDCNQHVDQDGDPQLRLDVDSLLLHLVLMRNVDSPMEFFQFNYNGHEYVIRISLTPLQINRQSF